LTHFGGALAAAERHAVRPQPIVFLLTICFSIKEKDERSLSALMKSARSGIMKYLLTSAGIKNTSIHDALIDLLGKPIADSSAHCIPTASYAQPGGAGRAWQFISGREPRTPLHVLDWYAVGA
jgi:hypothetical protein